MVISSHWPAGPGKNPFRSSMVGSIAMSMAANTTLTIRTWSRCCKKAVQSGEYAHYQAYARQVNERAPATLRDLLGLRSDKPSIDIDQVEPIKDILPRFDSAGMSLGALSPEAHEALAIAMNRLGGRSNSGEGGGRSGPLRHRKIIENQAGGVGVALASHRSTWSMPRSSRSRSPRGPNPAKAASCPATRSTNSSPGYATPAPASA